MPKVNLKVTATEVYFTDKCSLGAFFSAMFTLFVAICLLFNNQLSMLLKIKKKTIHIHIHIIHILALQFMWAIKLQPLSSLPISKYNHTL